MKHKRTILVVYKSAFALLGFSSIVLEIVTLLQRNVFNIGNFFSFFTVLANIFAATVLLASAVYVYRRRQPGRFNILRGAAALYMVLTGVVFALLLSNLDPQLLTALPWDNTVLHYIMPIVLFADWLIDPPKSKFSTKHIVSWLVFPTAYVTYSLIRGPIVDWYPYPFLDPAKSSYGQVVLISVFIAIFAVSAAILLVKAAAFVQKRR